jgi:serine/threonine-protein kinase
MEPETFGRYELLERIGIGGMAEVFKAVHRGVAGFQRLVAIKRILPSIAADAEIIRMFIDEAKLAVQLSHPNIAQIFDLGREGDDYFIAMEYVAGHSLKTLLERWGARGRRLPVAAVSHLVMQVADALHHAHFAQDPIGRPLGIIHRDVSPANILLSFGGEVKVIDFGLAKAANRVSQTRDGIVKGKLAYLSPEQAQGVAIDRRSDLFSLGICTWEMLTGRRAFLGENDRATVLAIRRGVVDPPSRFAEVPPELERIVMRALAPDREQRYRTALEIREDVDAFMHAANLEFSREKLHGLMRQTFPESFEDSAEEGAIELVREKPRGAPPSRARAPTDVDAIEELDDPDAIEDMDTETRDSAEEDPTTDPGVDDTPLEPSDTLPSIVVPDDRER